MHSFRASSRFHIALIALLGYLVLLLHPVLSHAGLFGGMLDNFSPKKSHAVAIHASVNILEDCVLCHMAVSFTPVPSVAAPGPDFHLVEQPLWVHSIDRVVSTIPGLRFPRAPPMMG